jgi:hypothetical protein
MMFTLFPVLAPELREMIWKKAIPQQRFVLVKDTVLTRQWRLNIVNGSENT